MFTYEQRHELHEAGTWRYWGKAIAFIWQYINRIMVYCSNTTQNFMYVLHGRSKNQSMYINVIMQGYSSVNKQNRKRAASSSSNYNVHLVFVCIFMKCHRLVKHKLWDTRITVTRLTGTRRWIRPCYENLISPIILFFYSSKISL